MEKTLTPALRATSTLLDRAEAAGIIVPSEAQARHDALKRLALLEAPLPGLSAVKEARGSEGTEPC